MKRNRMYTWTLLEIKPYIMETPWRALLTLKDGLSQSMAEPNYLFPLLSVSLALAISLLVRPCGHLAQNVALDSQSV